MDSILAKIQLPSKRKKPVPEGKIKLPEEIKLPDGRVFPTSDLLKKPTNKEYFDLRNPNRTPRKSTTTQKYYHNDWIWMAVNELEDIMERYTVNKEYAMILRSKGRKVLERFGGLRDDESE